jgi:hypothetical protein
MNEKSLKLLDRLIEGLPANILLSDKPGLFDGQAGIAILLYHYSRYMKDKQIESMADKLLGFVVERVYRESEYETAGITLSIISLMNDGFVDPDITVFEEIDKWLFDTGSREKKPAVPDERFLTGIYIYRRKTLDKCEDKTLRRERLKNNFKSTYLMLCNETYSYRYPVFKGSGMLTFFYLCSRFENDDYYKEEIELIYRDLSLIVEISIREEDSNADKYLLSLLMNGTVSGAQNRPFIIPALNKVSLMDINHFFLYRYLSGLDIAVPEIIRDEVISTVDNGKHIDLLLSRLCPDTSGLNSYIAGFAWALLQVCKEDIKP